MYSKIWLPVSVKLKRFWLILIEPVATIKQPEYRRRARLLSALLLFLFPLVLMGVLSVPYPPVTFLMLAEGGILLIAYAISRTKYYTLAAALTVGSITLLPFISLTIIPLSNAQIFATLMWILVGILLAGILLSLSNIVIFVGITVITILAIPIFAPQITYQVLTESIGLILTISTLIIVAAFVRYLDLRQIEQQTQTLRNNEARFKSLFEATFEGIAIHEAGILVDANHAFCNLFGYTPNQAIGMPVLNFIATSQQEIVKPNLSKLIKEPWETLGLKQDGTTIDIELMSKPHTYHDRLVQVIAIRDITARKQGEDAIQRAMVAEAANKAKSTFLANMSHEFRSPLNIILGFAQLLQRDAQIPPEQHKNLTIINQSAEYLLDLINDVLEMSKIEAGQAQLNLRDFDFHYLLSSLKELFRLQVDKKGLWLAFDYSLNLPTYIQADESKLRQILIILLDNAIKFTNQGGITLRVTYDTFQHTLFFEVEDTGIGIAADKLDTIFEAFVQINPELQNHKGTGLGLSISQKFVQLMGGSMSVSSKVGQGTIFKFNIKITPIDKPLIESDSHKQYVIGLQPNQAVYRILLVDDSEANRHLLTSLLKPVGFEVFEATNGQQGFEQWQQTQPHLIFIDMRMPVMLGYDVTKQIKATPQGQKTIVIAVTANIFTEQQKAVLDAGYDDFIYKPISQEEVFNVLHKHLGVEYIYSDTPYLNTATLADIHTTQEVKNALTPTVLGILTPNWLTDLEQVTLKCDSDEIFKMLEQLRPHNTALTDTLENWLDDFEYNKILDFIKFVKLR